MKLSLCKIVLNSLLLAYLPVNFSLAAFEPKINPQKDIKDYLIFTIPIPIKTFDPTKTLNAHTKLALPLIFEPLISVNAQQELKPILAESWLISPDFKSITITLRKNHYFSDGTEVTAEDVVKSIYRLCLESIKVPQELESLSGCKNNSSETNLPQVSAEEKYKVKFYINSHPTAFLYQLASPKTVIMKESKEQLIGSGPYQVAKQKNDHVILSKNPFYSGETIVNNDGLILYHASHDQLLDILKEKRPDGALMYKLQTIVSFNDNKYKVIKTNSNITEILVLNNKKFPLNNQLLRQALASTIYNNLSSNYAVGLHKAYGIIPNGLGGSIANISPDSLPIINPNEIFNAIPQLREKYASITIHLCSDFKNSEVEEKIIEAGKQYHININFKFHTDYPKLYQLYSTGKLDGFIEFYVYKDREAYSVIQFFTKDGSNHANLDNDNLDKMLKEALKGLTSHDRFQQYRQIAKYIQEEGIIIPLFYMDHDNIMSKCLAGISEDFYFNPFSYLPQIKKIEGCHP